LTGRLGNASARTPLGFRSGPTEITGPTARSTLCLTNASMSKKKRRKPIHPDDFDDRKLKRFIEDSFPEANGAAMPIGFANAFVGICWDERSRPVLVYDTDSCVQILMSRDDMTEEEAAEFFEFNVAGSKFGDGSHPMFMQVVPREAWAEKRKPGKR